MAVCFIFCKNCYEYAIKAENILSGEDKNMILKNCNAESFIVGLKGREVICFGAGTTLIEADLKVTTIDKLEDNIAFFVDNDKKKCGMEFFYCGREFDIKSPDIFNTINMSSYVILITCLSYVEIYKQLEAQEALKDIDCYMYDFICTYPDLDIDNYFRNEIIKKPFAEWKNILKGLRLKNKHKGERCFVIGNGPSLRADDLERLKGEITFGVNNIFNIFEQTCWRPTYYFWVDHDGYWLAHEEIRKMDVALKFIPIEIACAAGKVYDDITYYSRIFDYANIKDGKVVTKATFSFSENIEDYVYGGRTVLYDALQFAVYMGFSEIYLLGVDASYAKETLPDGRIIENDVEKTYFDEECEKGMEKVIKVQAPPIYAIEMAYEKCRAVCEEKGIRIRNATRGGKLEVFERVDFDRINII